MNAALPYLRVFLATQYFIFENIFIHAFQNFFSSCTFGRTLILNWFQGITMKMISDVEKLINFQLLHVIIFDRMYGILKCSQIQLLFPKYAFALNPNLMSELTQYAGI